MKTLLKRVSLTFVALFIVLNTMAVNVVDSDMSNTAGSNAGNAHLGFYLAICALIIASVIMPFIGKKEEKA